MDEQNLVLSFNFYLAGNLRRILGLMDRDFASPTFGSFDKFYWHYKMKSFPNAMMQNYTYSIALYYAASKQDRDSFGKDANKKDGSLNTASDYGKNPPKITIIDQSEIVPLVYAGIDALNKMQHKDGSFDEHYFNERSVVATAFTVLSTIKTLNLISQYGKDVVSEDKYESYRLMIEKALNWLIRNPEKAKISNHLAGVILCLLEGAMLLESPEFLKSALDYIPKLLSLQDEEGWFLEYDGNDYGYQTLTLKYLIEIGRLLEKIADTGQNRLILSSGHGITNERISLLGEKLKEAIYRLLVFFKFSYIPGIIFPFGPVNSRGTFHLFVGGFISVYREKWIRDPSIIEFSRNIVEEYIYNLFVFGRPSESIDDDIFLHFQYNDLAENRNEIKSILEKDTRRMISDRRRILGSLQKDFLKGAFPGYAGNLKGFVGSSEILLRILPNAGVVILNNYHSKDPRDIAGENMTAGSTPIKSEGLSYSTHDATVYMGFKRGISAGYIQSLTAPREFGVRGFGRDMKRPGDLPAEDSANHAGIGLKGSGEDIAADTFDMVNNGVFKRYYFIAQSFGRQSIDDRRWLLNFDCGYIFYMKKGKRMGSLGLSGNSYRILFRKNSTIRSSDEKIDGISENHGGPDGSIKDILELWIDLDGDISFLMIQSGYPTRLRKAPLTPGGHLLMILAGLSFLRTGFINRLIKRILVRNVVTGKRDKNPGDYSVINNKDVFIVQNSKTIPDIPGRTISNDKGKGRRIELKRYYFFGTFSGFTDYFELKDKINRFISENRTIKIARQDGLGIYIYDVLKIPLKIVNKLKEIRFSNFYFDRYVPSGSYYFPGSNSESPSLDLSELKKYALANPKSKGFYAEIHIIRFIDII